MHLLARFNESMMKRFWTVRSAWVVLAGWLVSIALNLVLVGALDVAVRDLAMAVGAYSLGTVAGLKGLEWFPGQSRSSARLRAPAATSR